MNGGTLNIWMPLVTLFVGIFGGGLGAWIGVKVAIARLEFWKEMTDGKIKELNQRSDWHHDDLMAHDFELAMALPKIGLGRAPRQRIRD